MKVIIADTSCLIIYDRINKLEILQNTFEGLIVTKEVAEEYGELPDWIKIRELEDEAQYLKLTKDLGKGEASSIALALEIKNSLLILDEKKGRKIAEELGVEIIGSLGVLIKAKDKGIIKSVKEVLVLIEKTDFRISEVIKKKLLHEAGE